MVGNALIGLVAFAGLFVLATWLVRKLQRKLDGGMRSRATSGQIKVLARYPLAWQSLLMVVDVAGTQYAIAVSRHGGVTLLGEPSMTVPDPPGHKSRFAKRLEEVIAHQGKHS